MRFTYLLGALVATTVSVSAQDLDSLLAEASSLIGTNTEYQSLLSSAASALDSATSALTGSDAALYSSYLSALESGLDSATSLAGSVVSEASAAATSVLGTAEPSAVATTNSDNGVDRVVLPAMGGFGAAILGLAAML
ncbi:uncharacterized protein Z518_05008 [Rhinocladiella mackenziei CBS 650.93]|uniref:Rhinocladiella mackenziei CBS 650.93 unplaced genomic scaffold supercont1.3, whole genome shotgun sequence n=1 Tax=Rhinocladiella mackenziei CBS 650.93 TaxID=1442369 RepID=A0A0D2IV57_9EURO|nr:uncharacterized protein Z518_05008 [Rhinocladiella mackenziei CBS 650.93]KIX07031.1 hypothetical protein Z518_05008 [Rhinocladiella mackenziei CBS 650.93]